MKKSVRRLFCFAVICGSLSFLDGLILPKALPRVFEPPRFELPKFEVPKFDMPDFHVPKLDIPDLNIPKFDIPDFDIPKFDDNIPKLDDDSLNFADNVPNVHVPKFSKNIYTPLPKTLGDLPLPKHLNDPYLPQTLYNRSLFNTSNFASVPKNSSVPPIPKTSDDLVPKRLDVSNDDPIFILPASDYATTYVEQLYGQKAKLRSISDALVFEAVSLYFISFRGVYQLQNSTTVKCDIYDRCDIVKKKHEIMSAVCNPPFTSVHGTVAPTALIRPNPSTHDLSFGVVQNKFSIVGLIIGLAIATILQNLVHFV